MVDFNPNLGSALYHPRTAVAESPSLYKIDADFGVTCSALIQMISQRSTAVDRIMKALNIEKILQGKRNDSWQIALKTIGKFLEDKHALLNLSNSKVVSERAADFLEDGALGERDFICAEKSFLSAAHAWEESLTSSSSKPNPAEIRHALHVFIDAAIFNSISHLSFYVKDHRDRPGAPERKEALDHLRTLWKDCTTGYSGHICSTRSLHEAVFERNESGLVNRQVQLLASLPHARRIQFAADSLISIGRHLRSIVMNVKIGADRNKFTLEYDTPTDPSRAHLNSVDYSLMVLHANVLLDALQSNNFPAGGPTRIKIVEAIYSAISADPFLMADRKNMAKWCREKNRCPSFTNATHFYPSDLKDNAFEKYFNSLEMLSDRLAAEIRNSRALNPKLVNCGWHIGSTCAASQTIEMASIAENAISCKQYPVSRYHSIPENPTEAQVQEFNRFEDRLRDMQWQYFRQKVKTTDPGIAYKLKDILVPNIERAILAREATLAMLSPKSPLVFQRDVVPDPLVTGKYMDQLLTLGSIDFQL